MISQSRVCELEAVCKKLRLRLINLLYEIQTGHPGGSLSCVEILVCLILEKMNFPAGGADDSGRDRLVLSKGHAAPMLYLTLSEKGLIPEKELRTLRRLGSRLQGHPSMRFNTPGIDCSSGPLGLGLSAALGRALGEARKKSGARVYALLGDGETQEGVVWEAAMAAAKYRAGNLAAIVDENRVQLDGSVESIMPIGDIGAKFRQFGWDAIECDGHDVAALCGALDKAVDNAEAPSLIVARTVKGKGVSFMENNSKWHGGVITGEDYKKAMLELEEGA